MQEAPKQFLAFVESTFNFTSAGVLSPNHSEQNLLCVWRIKQKVSTASQEESEFMFCLAGLRSCKLSASQLNSPANNLHSVSCSSKKGRRRIIYTPIQVCGGFLCVLRNPGRQTCLSPVQPAAQVSVAKIKSSVRERGAITPHLWILFCRVKSPEAPI